MPSHLYVTGTDTDVGKTFVAVQLIRHLISKGENVAAMKPVASGSVIDGEGSRNADAVTLMNTANVNAIYDDVNPYAFEPAIAPEYAARAVGTTIQLDVIKEAFERLNQRADRVVVEGAGGWLSPVNEDIDQADVARALGIEAVIVVVGMKLGCVHNARATLQAVAQSGMRMTGWVANEATSHDPNFDDNLQAIRRYTDAPLLATIRHNDERVEWFL